MNFVKKIKGFVQLMRIAEEYTKKHREKGVELDRRIDELTRATLNGENSWFLELVKEDPSCVLKVMEGCNTTNEYD